MTEEFVLVESANLGLGEAMTALDRSWPRQSLVARERRRRSWETGDDMANEVLKTGERGTTLQEDVWVLLQVSHGISSYCCAGQYFEKLPTESDIDVRLGEEISHFQRAAFMNARAL